MTPTRVEAEMLLFEFTQSEALGRGLDEHIAFVIAALMPIADELGL